MVVKTVVHFEIPAQDVERLSKFYKDVFGWKFERVPMGEFDYWTIETGPLGKSVGGGMYKRMHAKDEPRNFIGVEDIDSVIAAFKKAGGKSVMGKQEVPNIGFTFIGTDPEGNVIGLHEPIATGPASKQRKKKTK